MLDHPLDWNAPKLNNCIKLQYQPVGIPSPHVAQNKRLMLVHYLNESLPGMALIAARTMAAISCRLIALMVENTAPLNLLPAFKKTFPAARCLLCLRSLLIGWVGGGCSARGVAAKKWVKGMYGHKSHYIINFVFYSQHFQYSFCLFFCTYYRLAFPAFCSSLVSCAV